MKKKGFKTRLHTKLTSLKKAGNETECPAHCVIKRSLWRHLSLRSFSRNEQVVRSSWEEKSFVGKYEGDISAFGADRFLVFSVSYVPWQTRR